MDLSVVYTKTAKGLRARASIIGGISSQLMKVLSYVDGTSKAETILDKYDESELKLAAALTQLEAEGYIKPVITTRPGDDDWALATIFAPMEVEELQSAEEAEAEAQLQAEYKAKIAEDTRLQAERKAREKEEQDQAKEKIKAELKIKAQLEVERIASEAEETRKKAEAEAHAKAEEKTRLEAERKAKIEEEARQKAELKAQEAAERKAKAEEDARNRAELKAREAAEKIRVQAEAQLKERREQTRIAQEAKAKAEKEAELEAEAKAKAEEEARLKAELQAQEAAEQARAKAQAEAKENARREIERITQEAEEARKKVEAEEKAKAQAKLEAERQAKAEEEARSEAEAEAEAEKIRAKAEAEAKAKADEKERSRQDIARIVREAEEARKSEADAKEARLSAKQKEAAAEEQRIAEAEASAKAEQEAKLEAERKAKADEEARLKAETKAKLEAEQNRADAEAKEKASADANLKASLAMQSFAIEAEVVQKTPEIETPEHEASEVEVKPEASPATVQKTKSAAARLKAELKAKVEAEQQVLANYQAEQKAIADEKEIARQEMERISREAELERQKQQPQANVAAPVAIVAAAGVDADAIEVRWTNPDQDDDDEDFEEEERIAEEVEKVGREIKKKTKRVAEVEGREEIIRTAKEEAELKAKAKIESKTSVVTKNLGKWATVLRKVLLIYLPPAILLVLVLLHFINISPLLEPIEKLATESLGAPVKIEEVRASLWPRPHLVLKNVAIGADSAQKIASINIVPDTSSLSEEVKLLRSLEIEGLKIEQENFEQPLQWINGLSKAPHLKVEQITLKNIVLQIRDLELAPFDGKVALTELRELKSIDLSTDDETLAMQITPQGGSYEIAFTGTNWALPMNPKFVFSELKAKGTINQSLIFFNQIEGTIHGGSFTGKAALDWSSQWSVAGNFDLTNANLPEMLKAFASSASIDGKLNLTGIFSCKSDQAATLTDAPEISASFEVLKGKINGVELERAVLAKGNQSLAGDSTHFDKLTGNVKVKNGSYQYKQLALKSDQFYADGNVDIQPNQDISGNISASLAAQSRRLQASFNLAGTANNVQRK